MGPDQEVVVCSKSSRFKKDDSLYIINIFKKKSSINLLTQGIEDMKKTGYLYYVEHFLQNNKLYVIFNYFAPCRVKQFMKLKILSFAERLKTANSFFSNALELRILPLIMQYKFLEPDNININEYGIVYFSHILDFREKSEDISEQNIIERIGYTLTKVFEGHSDIPQTFTEYLNSIKNNEFENVEAAYAAFRPFLKEFVGDGDIPYSLDTKPTPDIIMQPKVKISRSSKAFKSILISLLVLCISVSLYYGFRFLSSLTKSIKIPVDAPIDTQIATPTWLPSANSDASPQPTLDETPKSTPVPTSSPLHSASPEPSTASKPVTSPDVIPVSTPDITPIPSPNVTPVSSGSPIPTPTAQPEYILYEVQKGEWLKEICRRYYGNPDYYKQVSVYNNIQNPSEINAGQVIKLPNINMLEVPDDSSSDQD